jgi:hypothetical protein
MKQSFLEVSVEIAVEVKCGGKTLIDQATVPLFYSPASRAYAFVAALERVVSRE